MAVNKADENVHVELAFSKCRMMGVRQSRPDSCYCAKEFLEHFNSLGSVQFVYHVFLINLSFSTTAPPQENNLISLSDTSFLIR